MHCRDVLHSCCWTVFLHSVPVILIRYSDCWWFIIIDTVYSEFVQTLFPTICCYPADPVPPLMFCWPRCCCCSRFDGSHFVPLHCLRYRSCYLGFLVVHLDGLFYLNVYLFIIILFILFIPLMTFLHCYWLILIPTLMMERYWWWVPVTVVIDFCCCVIIVLCSCWWFCCCSQHLIVLPLFDCCYAVPFYRLYCCSGIVSAMTLFIVTISIPFPDLLLPVRTCYAVIPCRFALQAFVVLLHFLPLLFHVVVVLHWWCDLVFCVLLRCYCSFGDCSHYHTLITDCRCYWHWFWCLFVIDPFIVVTVRCCCCSELTVWVLLFGIVALLVTLIYRCLERSALFVGDAEPHLLGIVSPLLFIICWLLHLLPLTHSHCYCYWWWWSWFLHRICYSVIPSVIVLFCLF